MNVIEKRKQAERQERIDRILKAGRKLFLKKGYLGATVRDIARAAEMSTGVIYLYFEGKDDIYGRICEEAFHILIKLLREASTRGKTTMERLDAIARAYVKFYTDFPDYFDILSFRDMGFKKVGLPDELLEKLDQLSAQSLSILNDVVRNGIEEEIIDHRGESWEMTFALWAVIEGLISIHKRGYMDTFGLQLEELLNHNLRIILKGILVK